MLIALVICISNKNIYSNNNNMSLLPTLNFVSAYKDNRVNDRITSTTVDYRNIIIPADQINESEIPPLC